MENQAAINTEQSDDSWQAAKSVISSLLLAVKINDLYPESHIRCQQAISRFHSELEMFHRCHGNLGLKVQQNKLIFRGEEVYTGPDKEGDMVFALFRDGIEWLEFQEGIELWQTEEFMTILNNYKRLPLDADGDLVTALWEAQLPNFRYHAMDTIFETTSLSNVAISTAKETEPLESLLEKELLGSEPSVGTSMYDIFQDSQAEVNNFKDIDLSSLALTADDAADIEKMIVQQEEQDNSQDLIDMFMDILIDQKDRDFFISVLEFLIEELEKSINLSEFGSVYEILQKLHDISKTWEKDRVWAISLIENLFLNACESPDFWKALDKWSETERALLEKVKPLMKLLPPKAIENLASRLPEISSSKLQMMLMELIISLASKDFKPLEQLIRNSEQDLVKRLLPLLGHLEGKKSAELLIEMTQHSSDGVRKEALRALMLRDVWAPKKLFHLIDDDHDFTRRLFIKYLGSRKCKEAEDLLLNYLPVWKVRNVDTGHLFACFRALGRCGSDRTIQFLRKIISKRIWFFRNKSSFFRKAAAIALEASESEEAKDILKKAGFISRLGTTHRDR